ncbi:Prp5 pre-mRNA processing RNA-helicase [Candida orthopsilosis Co 90-125]|uniref:RNA helicase n=1 Tax=Candida orthopsilosis (strain 90-125) TaxID=1136231 RepID=H8X3H1_CANO9|nr:Prp5 pre-mRNA processing RNA-helicase [Candida orthopsilosis Co 90-125]CCG25444.1 Prp5 pre-mRNA processing RNA-helicase [Candida orthopsilosis Co 90-125]
MSKSTNSVPNMDVNTNQSDTKESKDEVLKKRREQLAAWRAKKQQESKQLSETPPSNIADGSGNTSEVEKRLRQQRLEQWKKSRSQKDASPSPQTNQSSTKIRLSKKPRPSSRKNQPQLKRKIDEFDFDVDENQQKKLKFVTPQSTFGNPNNLNNGQEQGVDDELDAFMKSIDTNETKVEANGALFEIQTNSTDDESADEDIDIQALIDSKLAKLNTTKELKDIDHSQVSYPPFRKNFYKVPFELSLMSEDELGLLRLDLDDIRVRGKNVPSPFTKWSQLLLPENIISVVNDQLQFDKPSPVQAQAIPIILSGRDLIGVAKTGSGKTLSYVLPMMRHIQEQAASASGDGPVAVILSPTRELALQIEQEVLNFTRKVDKRVTCCYGGSKIENQISDLRRGVDVVVATPGRMIDLLAANGGRVTSMRRTTFVVLDEADRMFDLGFEPQIRKILSQVRPDRQTVLFSATFPRKLEILVKQILSDPVEVIVGGVGVVAKEIKQNIMLLDKSDDEYFQERLKMLRDYVQKHIQTHQDSKILIFVEKQVDADKLLFSLLSHGLPCVAIHAGKEQIDRKYAIKEFSAADSGVNILIATSIAARGLDVKNLGLVVNFDPPSHLEDYVHRVGRTGRAGADGIAITFVSRNQEKEINVLVKALKLSSNEVTPELQIIADSFNQKVKAGGAKVGFGFGGKGLDNLQEVRENKLKMEKKMYGEEAEDKEKENGVSTNSKEGSPSIMTLPSFDIIEGNSPETAGPDKCKFFCRITINDLPQKVRWDIVQREQLSKIIEGSRTSITTKGQYYPPTHKFNTSKDTEPKLYLLVEGLTRKSIEDAISLIKERMFKSIESMTVEDRGGITGRYTV